MLGRKNTKRVLIMTLAALFVMAFAYQASAFSSGGSTPFAYTGKIVALDSRILTVQAAPNAEHTFNLADSVEVMKCDMAASLSDLKIGDEVTVSYFDEGNGKLIASGIDYAASGMQRC